MAICSTTGMKRATAWHVGLTAAPGRKLATDGHLSRRCFPAETELFMRSRLTAFFTITETKPAPAWLVGLTTALVNKSGPAGFFRHNPQGLKVTRNQSPSFLEKPLNSRSLPEEIMK